MSTQKSRKQNGGMDSTLVDQIRSEGNDLNLYFDRFIRKRINQNEAFKPIISETDSGVPDLKTEEGTTNSILVIDMQNDFILFPCGAPGVPEKPNCGTFSVTHGVKVIEPMKKWLDKNIEKCTKVIFSRDSHDPKHCSFQEEGGPFPNHCAINSNGAELHPEFDGYKSKSNVEVIFKGMSKTTESFGAMKYADSEYSKTRQIGDKCCENKETAGTGGCLDLTGGFYMDGALNAHTFSATPFKDGYEWIDGGANAKFRPFDPTKDLFGETPPKTHNIYVVGLAADWCVRDTAYNLGMLAKSGAFGDVTVNVFVVHDLCRNSFVPVWAGQYKKDLPGALNKFKAVTPDKPLTDYAFKIVPNEGAPPHWEPLAASELETITEERLGPAAPKADIFMFLNEPTDILQNYLDAGVKLIIKTKSTDLESNENYLGKPTGGSRHKNVSKKRKSKRSRKNKINKRKSRR